jgi:hypothetical protein
MAAKEQIDRGDDRLVLAASARASCRYPIQNGLQKAVAKLR